MPAQTSSVAEILLRRLSANDRAIALRDIATSLTDSSDYGEAGSLAQLLEAYPDAEALDKLRTFLLDKIAAGFSAAAAQVCKESMTVRHVLLEEAIRSLETEREHVFTLESSATDDEYEHSTPNAPSSDQSLETVRNHLEFFLHTLRWTSHHHPLLVEPRVVSAIVPFLLVKNEKLFGAARETIFALFGALHRHTAVSKDEALARDFYRDLWTSCIERLITLTDSRRLSTALQIWLRWLDLSLAPDLCHEILDNDEYWRPLLYSLFQGDFEVIKACLHILRKSLAVVINKGLEIQCSFVKLPGPRSVNLRHQQAYERYLTIYETMVVGRYINQIRECERDLDTFALPQSLVESPWLLALLMATLTTKMQDSIQKFSGSWFMRSNLKISGDHELMTLLLDQYFLPWAMEGPLFTSTTTGTMRDMHCEHGDLLASFVERTIHYQISGDSRHRQEVVKTLVGYLNRNRNNILAHGVVYVLNGIVRGLQPGHDVSLTQDVVGCLQSLAAVSGLPEVIKDLVLLQTVDICKRSPLFPQLAMPELAEDKVMQSKFSTMQARLDRLKDAQHLALGEFADSHDGQWPSISALLDELDRTNCACLSGPALLAACNRLSTLVNNEVDVDPEGMHRLLHAVWTEIEIQDYQKIPLQLLPRIIFSPVVVRLALSNATFKDFLVPIFEQYRPLIQGRIYLWTPVMRALRSALISEPALANVINFEEFVVNIADRPPSPKLEFQLDAAALSLLTNAYSDFSGLSYRHYYGEHASLGYAAFFDTVRHTDVLGQDVTDRLYERLLRPWETQRLPPPVVNKWKTTEQLQILLLLLEQRLARKNTDTAAQDLAVILRLLSVEPLPRFRFLLEWMVSRIIHRHKHLRDDIVAGIFTRDHHSNPKYLASLTKLSVTFACFANSEEDFGIKVGSGLVALSASAKSVNRHEAQWQFPILWDHAEKQGWRQFTFNPGFRQLMEFIKSLEVYRQPPLERRLERLDPINDFSLTNLLSGMYLYLEPPGVTRVQWDDFIRLRELDPMFPRAGDKSDLVPVGDELGQVPSRSPLPSSEHKTTQAGDLGALQTKGTAYLSSAATDDDNETRPSDLLVVGSLVDSAYNLGGLSRVSEIFGAAALYIANPSTVLSHKDFISVAVSSQNHIPIKALAPADLPAWLTTKKNQGYCIVGIEQTDRSMILGAEGTVLPRKTVLVLGAEKEGMPALIMGECDVLVEIPQKGKTRSLNVQTAAAAVLFEYARQRRGV